MAHSVSKTSLAQTSGQHLASRDDAAEKASLYLEKVIDRIASLPPTRETMQFFSNKMIQYEKEQEAFKQKLEKYMRISNDRNMLEMELLRRGDKITALQRAVSQLQDNVRVERQKVSKLESEVQRHKDKENEYHLRIQGLLKMTENTPLHENIIYIFKKPYPLSISQRLLGVRQDEQQTRVKQVSSDSSRLRQYSSEIESKVVDSLREQIDHLQEQMELQNKLVEQRVEELLKDCSANLEEADNQNKIFKEKINSLISKLKDTEDYLKRTNCELLNARKVLRQQEIFLYVGKGITNAGELESAQNISNKEVQTEDLSRLSSKDLSNASGASRDNTTVRKTKLRWPEPSAVQGTLDSAGEESGAGTSSDQQRSGSDTSVRKHKPRWPDPTSITGTNVEHKARAGTSRGPRRSESDSSVRKTQPRWPGPAAVTNLSAEGKARGGTSRYASGSESDSSIQDTKQESSSVNVVIPDAKVPSFLHSKELRNIGLAKRPNGLYCESTGQFINLGVGSGDADVLHSAIHSSGLISSAYGRQHPKSNLAASSARLRRSQSASSVTKKPPGPSLSVSARQRNNNLSRMVRPKSWLSNLSVPSKTRNDGPKVKTSSKSGIKTGILRTKSGQTESLNRFRQSAVPEKTSSLHTRDSNLTSGKSVDGVEGARSVHFEDSVSHQRNKCDATSQTSPKQHRRMVSVDSVPSSRAQTAPLRTTMTQCATSISKSPTICARCKQSGTAHTASVGSEYIKVPEGSKSSDFRSVDFIDNALETEGTGDSMPSWQSLHRQGLSDIGGMGMKNKLDHYPEQKKPHVSRDRTEPLHEQGIFKPSDSQTSVKSLDYGQTLPLRSWQPGHESSQCMMCSKQLPRVSSSDETTTSPSCVSMSLTALPESPAMSQNDPSDALLRNALSQLEKTITSKISDFKKSNTATCGNPSADTAAKSRSNVIHSDKAVQTMPLSVLEQLENSDRTSPSKYVDILHLVSHKRCEEEINNLMERLKKQSDEFQELRQKAETDRFYAKEANSQSRKLEEQLQFEKEHRDAYILPFQNQNKELIEQLRLSRSQLQRLDQFRRLEVEGFRTDIKNLTEKIKNIEKQIMKALVQFESKEYDLELLRTVHRSTKHSERVTNEIKRLKAKLYEIENEIRNI